MSGREGLGSMFWGGGGMRAEWWDGFAGWLGC